MSKWIAEFDLEDGDTMPEHMELEYKGARIDFHCKPLEQQPCEDCISRQAVLDIAKTSKSNWIDNSVLFKRVNDLPPVTPQSKTGWWIEHEIEDTCRWLECSNCHHEIYNVKHNYCPNCGAKMQEVEE